jgi:hypothetical protein
MPLPLITNIQQQLNHVKIGEYMTDFTPSDFPSLSRPVPNPVTRLAHRKEVLRQITLPLVIAILLISVAVYYLVQMEIGSVERWAEISFIVLIVFLSGTVLFPLVLIMVLIYVITQLLRILPIYARQAQIAIERVKSQVRSGADVSVAPLMQIQSFLAMVETLFGRRK